MNNTPPKNFPIITSTVVNIDSDPNCFNENS